MRFLPIVAVGLLALLLLSACNGLLESADFFAEIAEKGDAISTSAIEKAAASYELYCDKVPRSVQERINERFNESTTTHRMPKWCPEE
jgi:hypothetical protein